MALRLKYYPENYNILILTTTLEDLKLFEEYIKSISDIIPKRKEKSFIFNNNHVCIQGYCANRQMWCGFRANSIIVDMNFGEEEIYYVFAPIVNAPPVGDIYIYNPKDLDEFEEYHKRYEDIYKEKSQE